jgi:hypothetical protein
MTGRVAGEPAGVVDLLALTGVRDALMAGVITVCRIDKFGLLKRVVLVVVVVVVNR